jgi:hypothetical protein
MDKVQLREWEHLAGSSEKLGGNPEVRRAYLGG